MAELTVGPTKAIDRTQAADLERERAETNPLAQPRQVETDRVDLSEAAREAQRAEAVDAQRLEQIREAIEAGNYPLDSRRIAESFVALEQMISS